MTPSEDYRDLPPEDERGSDILVIGVGPVSRRAILRLARSGRVAVIREADQLIEVADEHAERTLVVESITDFIKEANVAPHPAIGATSQDSPGPLIAQQLRLDFDLEVFVVRVNDPQYIDAIADLPVETVDAVGSALVRHP